MYDHNNKAGYHNQHPALCPFLRPISLCLPYPEHLGVTYRAYALGRRLAIFHRYGLGVFHFSLGLTFYTVSLHVFTSFLL